MLWVLHLLITQKEHPESAEFELTKATVNSDFFAIILFSRIALKDIRDV